MTGWTLPPFSPIEATGAAIGAAAIATFLAPLLAYTAVGAVAGYPSTGAVLGLYLVPFFPMVAPLQFAFVFLCCAAIGCVLVLCGARHVAFFVVAGAILGVLAWVLMPVLVGLGKQPLFLAGNSDAGYAALVIGSMAVAGAVNGAIYWFLIGKFSPSRSLPTGDKTP